VGTDARRHVSVSILHFQDTSKYAYATANPEAETGCEVVQGLQVQQEELVQGGAGNSTTACQRIKNHQSDTSVIDVVRKVRDLEHYWALFADLQAIGSKIVLITMIHKRRRRNVMFVSLVFPGVSSRLSKLQLEMKGRQRVRC
jgi:hypothetical protein